MQKLSFLVFVIFNWHVVNAQPVEVRADYNGVGDVELSAYNNTKAPLFVHILLGDLENTYYRETLPIVKKVNPGFNTLFTLEHNLGAEGSVRFHHEIKYFRSNPVADVNLDFPYLIPLEPGKRVHSVLVEDIDGFWGMNVPKSWAATGFKVNQGDKVFAARNGIIVEITDAKHDETTLVNYNGWNYTVTILQPDGTLACYRNVADSDKQWKVGDKIYSGQFLGKIIPGATQLVFLVFHESLNSKDLKFIFPQFVISENKTDLILSETDFTVVHPLEIKGLEMDKREKRRFLK